MQRIILCFSSFILTNDIKLWGTNKVLLHGVVGADGLYDFQHVQLLSPPDNSTSPSFGLHIVSSNLNKYSLVNNNAQLWHNRLGHPSHHVMQIVFKQCHISMSSPKNKSGLCTFMLCWKVSD